MIARLSAILALLVLPLTVATPASAATENVDLAVSVTATADTITAPTVLHYEIQIGYVSGLIDDVTPADGDIQLILPEQITTHYGSEGSCYHVGDTSTCHYEFLDESSGPFIYTIDAQVALIAVGQLTATVELDSQSPSDPELGNNVDQFSCTAVTGLLVLC